MLRDMCFQRKNQISRFFYFLSIRHYLLLKSIESNLEKSLDRTFLSINKLIGYGIEKTSKTNDAYSFSIEKNIFRAGLCVCVCLPVEKSKAVTDHWPAVNISSTWNSLRKTFAIFYFSSDLPLIDASQKQLWSLYVYTGYPPPT
jgi:hypothetical protein